MRDLNCLNTLADQNTVTFSLLMNDSDLQLSDVTHRRCVFISTVVYWNCRDLRLIKIFMQVFHCVWLHSVETDSFHTSAQQRLCVANFVHGPILCVSVHVTGGCTALISYREKMEQSLSRQIKPTCMQVRDVFGLAADVCPKARRIDNMTNGS